MTASIPTTSDWALDLTHVDKVYDGGGMIARLAGGKGVHALRGVEMRVRRGEVFGLLGPNGAGKSTLVKILMTIIKPTRCEGTMLGHRVGEKSVLERVGYLPEHHKFPEYLNGSQVLNFYGALSNVPRDVRRGRAAELLELVGMSAWGDKKVKGYSKGMRQRLGIANALMNDPDLVVLDEPTDGVDPVGRKDIREVLVRLKEQGKTIFLNSHLLSELEMVCDRVSIMVQGLVSAQGTMDELTRESRRFEIVVDPASREAAGTLEEITSRAGVRGWSDGKGGREGLLPSGEVVRVISTPQLSSVIAMTDNALLVQPIIDALRQHQVVIRAVRPVRASLEDLFMAAVTDPNTGRSLAPGAADESKLTDQRAHR